MMAPYERFETYSLKDLEDCAGYLGNSHYLRGIAKEEIEYRCTAISDFDSDKKIATESEAIDQACRLQDRLGLQADLKIDLLNGEPDAIIAVFNRVLDEIEENHRHHVVTYSGAGSDGSPVACHPHR